MNDKVLEFISKSKGATLEDIKDKFKLTEVETYSIAAEMIDHDQIIGDRFRDNKLVFTIKVK